MARSTSRRFSEGARGPPARCTESNKLLQSVMGSSGRSPGRPQHGSSLEVNCGMRSQLPIPRGLPSSRVRKCSDTPSGRHALFPMGNHHHITQLGVDASVLGLRVVLVCHICPCCIVVDDDGQLVPFPASLCSPSGPASCPRRLTTLGGFLLPDLACLLQVWHWSWWHAFTDSLLAPANFRCLARSALEGCPMF